MLHQVIASQQVQVAVNLETGKAQAEREQCFMLALKFVQLVEARLRYGRLFDRNGQELFTVHDVVNAVLDGRWSASAHSPKCLVIESVQ